MRPARRRVAAWIASFGILLAALAPALAQAFGPGAGSPVPWSEICSASGTGTTPDVESSTPGDGQTAHDAKHCAWCTSQGTHAWLVPLALTFNIGPTAEICLDNDAGTAAPRPTRRSPSQPRAPPFRS
mgnify:CR=1 FL=1